MKKILNTVLNTGMLRLFGLWKIPLIFFVAPTVEEITDKRCVVRIPFKRRNRNHVGSLYFGALCIGADCAGGLIAMKSIQEKKATKNATVSLLFKNFKADFLRRAEGDVFFTCEQGVEIAKLVERVLQSGERENLPVRVVATTGAREQKEGAFGDGLTQSVVRSEVAHFELTLSLKRQA